MIRKIGELPKYDEIVTCFFKITSETTEYKICALRTGRIILLLAEVVELPTRILVKLAALASKNEWELEKREGAVIQTDPSLIAQLNAMCDCSNEKLMSVQDTSETEKLFYKICKKAIEVNASDIFIEHRPFSEKSNIIKMRVDGSVQEIQGLSSEEAGTLIAVCYNVLADEDSKESAYPSFIRTTVLTAVIQYQDTQHSARLRMTSSPAHFKGTDMVFRLTLETDEKPPTLKELGYADGHLEIINRMAATVTGVLVFCGLPGAGKSTAIRSILAQLHKTHPGKRIGMIEDPVEHLLEGVNQLSLNDIRVPTQKEAWKLAIKGMVRANADIMAIGEVRDNESAEEMTNYILAGHQVITTLHTESAIGGIERLVMLGISRNTLASPGFITGLIYQKLIPKLCPGCAVPLTSTAQLSPELFNRLAKIINPEEDIINLRGAGCELCKDRRLGYHGRIVAVETMQIDNTMRSLIREGNDLEAFIHWRQKKIRHQKLGHGTTAFDNAIQLMKKGVISPEDVEANFMYLDSETEG